MEKTEIIEGVGAFPVGHWHASGSTQPLDWDKITTDEILPTVPWTLEQYENVLFCFFSEVRHDRYLKNTLSGVAMPVTALWASFSHLSSKYEVGPIIDVEHHFRFFRNLKPGESTVLSGSITAKYEKKSHFYIEWETKCHSTKEEPIFIFNHTIIDLREAS